MAVVVVFAILVVASRSLGHYRRQRLSVADSDVTGGGELSRSMAIGAGLVCSHVGIGSVTRPSAIQRSPARCRCRALDRVSR